MASVRLFSLLYSFSLIFIAGARMNLECSDRNALVTIQKGLGITDGYVLGICNSANVFCEPRISNYSDTLRIVRIVYESKRLDGFLSPAIGRLSELKELSLPDNRLLDRIPPQIVRCKKLEVLNLRSNRFGGTVPSDLSKLTRLRSLDLSSNTFTGDLYFLKHFPNLETLSLSNNMFTGNVPISLRSFRNLQFVNISGNNIVNDPWENNGVPRRYVLAESNSAQSPTTAPSESQHSSASDDYPAPSSSPLAAPDEQKKHKRKAKGLILGFLAGAAAGGFFGTVFSFLLKLLITMIKGGTIDSGPAIFAPTLIKKEHLAFLEKDDALASVELVGRGGCGEVYKAELPESKVKMIAIKKIIQPPVDATELTEEDTKLLNRKMRQIKSEIQTVGQIRHRNLLPLLAHMTRPDCHYLIYEFMKNGSLQDILNQASEGTRELDWPSRHRIARGIAAGLEYLHMHHSPRIIHRDLKPANVLLDDDMEARIADFGLAKMVPNTETHMTSSNVAGTLGYISPEYHQTMKFTDKCDIYSFGVLLGVLVIGKLPSDEFFQDTEEMSLVKWMRNVMTSDNPKQAIDPNLLGNGCEEQMLLVLKIACFCTLENPKERPNSKDVRCMLDQIIQ